MQPARVIYRKIEGDKSIRGQIRLKDIISVHQDKTENWKITLTAKKGRKYLLEDPEKNSMHPWMTAFRGAWKTELSPVYENPVTAAANAQPQVHENAMERFPPLTIPYPCSRSPTVLHCLKR